MKREKKVNISHIDLSELNETTEFTIDIPTIYTDLLKEKQEFYYQTEKLRNKSVYCIKNQNTNYTKNRITTELTYKMLLIIITSLFAYYGIYYVSITYFQNNLEENEFNAVLFLLLILLTGFIIYAFYKKDFWKIHLIIYTIIFGIISIFGLFTILTQYIIITSYQILNFFIILLFLQIFIFIISMIFTKRIVCHTNSRQKLTPTLDFE